MARRYRAALTAIVDRLAETVRKALGLRLDASVSRWTVRAQYGKEPRLTGYLTEQAATEAYEAVLRSGHPAELLPPGPVPDWLTAPEAVIKQATAGIGNLQTPGFLAKVVDPIGEAVDAANLRNLGQSLGIDLTATDIGPQLAAFAEENAGLIKSLTGDCLAQVASLVQEAHSSGMPTDKLAALVEERFSVAKSRATLIAQDQVAKLNSKITQARQQAAGVTEYIWSTSQDERVRPSHRDLNGKRFSYDKPPAEGNPGEPVRCRCVPIPVMPWEYD